MQQSPAELRNLFLAFVISGLIIFLWQYFYVMPQQEAERKQMLLRQAEQTKTLSEQKALIPSKEDVNVTRPENIPHINISSDKLHGRISLKGIRFDKLTFTQYRENIDKTSPEVQLFYPSTNDKNGMVYFAESGWISSDSSIKTPDNKTIWKADSSTLTPEKPVKLSWNNGQGIEFITTISLDAKYMFKFEHKVINNSGKDIELYPYSLLNRTWAEHENVAILHEGVIGSFDGTLNETRYEDIKEKGSEKHPNSKGWIGITDKYWLAAIIPDSSFTANMSYIASADSPRYQADFMGDKSAIASGSEVTRTIRFFAGPKELNLLDGYAKEFNVPMFDRAVDLGILYFLTRPIFVILNYFNGLLGNFGLAIMLLTVCIKAILFPLANKSYRAINAMKRLQPEVTKLRERFESDKMRLNKEIMELYKREKVNPMAGCLPIIIQLPIFFALYKVLFVTIEMRHAPFYLWIHDLSAPDPTNMFNLFGLIAWTPPAFLHVGVLPLIMFATTVIQQKLQPKPSDPVQEKVMMLLPYIFLFLFASFPAGLILYWSWSNFLSIIQQLIIARIHNDKPANSNKPVKNKKK